MFDNCQFYSNLKLVRFLSFFFLLPSRKCFCFCFVPTFERFINKMRKIAATLTKMERCVFDPNCIFVLWLEVSHLPLPSNSRTIFPLHTKFAYPLILLEWSILLKFTYPQAFTKPRLETTDEHLLITDLLWISFAATTCMLLLWIEFCFK